MKKLVLNSLLTNKFKDLNKMLEMKNPIILDIKIDLILEYVKKAIVKYIFKFEIVKLINVNFKHL